MSKTRVLSEKNGRLVFYCYSGKHLWYNKESATKCCSGFVRQRIEGYGIQTLYESGCDAIKLVDSEKKLYVGFRWFKL